MTKIEAAIVANAITTTVGCVAIYAMWPKLIGMSFLIIGLVCAVYVHIALNRSA